MNPYGGLRSYRRVAKPYFVADYGHFWADFYACFSQPPKGDFRFNHWLDEGVNHARPERIDYGPKVYLELGYSSIAGLRRPGNCGDQPSPIPTAGEIGRGFAEIMSLLFEAASLIVAPAKKEDGQ